MFLRLCQANVLVSETNARENAIRYINRAKRNARRHSKSRDERCALLCGNAGIYAVSAAIAQHNADQDNLKSDLAEFARGFEACKPIAFSKYGSDEILVGRAGFLSGVYWLNDVIRPPPFSSEEILEICESTVVSGRQYSKAKRSPFPLMYQYHSTEYLGAAHGLCGILHMLLDSPWFRESAPVAPPKEYLADIKATVDGFVGECISRNSVIRFQTETLFSSASRSGGKFPLRHAGRFIAWGEHDSALVSRCSRRHLLDRKSISAVPRRALPAGVHSSI